MERTAWKWRAVTLSLILVTGAAHLLYIARGPVDLSPDEAHYWLWSQQLDWSYYSKGPLTAWLIRLSCECLGQISQSWAGSEALAVRFPAVVCGSVLLWAIHVLAVQVFGREAWGSAAVAAALTLPPVALGRSLMTIDAPYTCCWAVALVLGFSAIFDGKRWAWPLLGVVIGCGILAKYTMILWPASAGLFLATSQRHRQQLFRPGIWIMAFVAAIFSLPIVWWNHQHDWISLRHVGTQAGVESGSSWNWTGPITFLAGQWGVLLGFWFCLWAAAMWRYRPWHEKDESRRFLWYFSAPQFVLFAAFSFRTKVQANWPITAYISGLLLVLPVVSGWLVSESVVRRRWSKAFLGFTAAASLFALTVVHAAPWVRPWLAEMMGPGDRPDALPIRKVDPTARLSGWSFLAGEVDELRRALRQEGIEPILAASRWTTASELAFYCEGRPKVFSLGSALWDRQSQFDLWRPNPVSDPGEYLGATMIFVDVGRVPPEIIEAFEKIEPTRQVVYRDRGVPVAIWDVTICRGFRGFANLPPPHY